MVAPKKTVKEKDEGLFKSVMLAYMVLVLHVLLMVVLGLMVIFFRGVVQYMFWIFIAGALAIIISGYYFYRRMKAEGKTLKQMLSSPVLNGRPVEVSFLGGLASFRVGAPGHAPQIESGTANPTQQLEDPETIRIRELTELARMLEKNLITREEYNQAKHALLNPKISDQL
jgi:hypothetical protein